MSAGGLAKEDGHRRVAARPPQQPCFTGHDPGHGIIDPGDNVSIMKQEKIGQAVQSFQGLLVARADRLVAEIAAGHDERGRSLGLG